MKRKAIIIAVVIIACVVCVLTFGQKAETATFLDKYSKIMEESSVFKFEKLQPSASEPLYVNLKFTTFLDLAIETVDIKPGTILYRVTFEPKEIVKNGKELVVEIGENSIIVNGETYGFESRESYESFLTNAIAPKYKYYSENY